MIEFDHVSLKLGQFSLADVCLNIDQGDYYFILGPSGAGKTVILEAIAGLHAPDRGRVMIRGEDATLKPPEKRGISLVYQDYSLFPHMTVSENIAFGLRLRRLPRHEISSRVDGLLDRFGLTHLSSRHPATMSGGEQQRVAIARAIAVEPDILLLDEPMSALDPITKDRVIEDLRSLHSEQDLTIVQVTHARGEAMRLANRVAVIIDGKLVAESDADGIFNTPRTREIAQFVGIENILDGVVTENRNRIATVDIDGCLITAISPFEKGMNVSVCVRAEDIVLSLHHPEDVSTRNVFEGIISGFVPLGPVVRISIDGDLPLVATVIRDTVEALGLVVGKKVYASFKASSTILAKAD
jgi:molybdate/tungstate transport system ATP-binding protein